MVAADAASAEGKGRRQARAPSGDVPRADAWFVGSAAAVVPGGLSVSASAQEVAALSGVSAGGFAHWQRCDGGGVQDRVHAALKAVRDALGSVGRPGGRESARRAVERHLASNGGQMAEQSAIPNAGS